MILRVVPAKVYLGVFGLLLVLTGATVGLAYLDLGPINLPIALSIAAVKMSLIALYFMHLRHAKRLDRLAAAAGLFWLAVLIALTLADFATRAMP